MRDKTMKKMNKTKLRALHNRYGCELATVDLPNDVKRGLTKLGLGTRFLTVPKRKNGLTSSGKPHECHRNVAMLVENFGGKHLKGFCLNRVVKLVDETTIFKFIWHSVWVTPEGKAICPTMMEGDLDALVFIPVHEWTPVLDFYGEDFVLSDITKVMGMRLETGIGSCLRETALTIPFNRMKPETIMCGAKLDPVKDAVVLKKNREWYVKSGGFTKPSMGTGRFLNKWKEAA